MSKENTTHTYVNTIEALKGFLTRLAVLPDQSCLSVAVEGNCNSPMKRTEQGTISVLDVYVQAYQHTYMIDIHSLQSAAFTTAITVESETCEAVVGNADNDDSGFFDDNNGDIPSASTTTISLATILTSPTPSKLVFDVRTISHVLYTHFGIKLQGIEDIQLLELAARPTGRRKFLMSLEKCVDIFSPLAGMKKVGVMEWELARMQGRNLVAADGRGDLGRGRQRNRGGEVKGRELDDGGVWTERPLDSKLLKYALANVSVLQGLKELFCGRLMNREDEYGESWAERANREAVKRVEVTWEDGYVLTNSRGAREHGPWKE